MGVYAARDMASSTRRLQRRRPGTDAMRAKLLVVVERLLDEASFAEITVDRIVGEAGYHRSSFYGYFEDKGDLLRAAVEEVADELTQAHEAWWALDAAITATTLHNTLERLVQAYWPHATLLSAVDDIVSFDVRSRELVASVSQRNIEGLAAHIDAGQRAGYVNPTLRPLETAAWLTSMFELVTREIVRSADEREIRTVVDTYQAITWKTLYEPAL